MTTASTPKQHSSSTANVEPEERVGITAVLHFFALLPRGGRLGRLGFVAVPGREVLQNLRNRVFPGHTQVLRKPPWVGESWRWHGTPTQTPQPQEVRARAREVRGSCFFFSSKVRGSGVGRIGESGNGYAAFCKDPDHGLLVVVVVLSSFS